MAYQIEAITCIANLARASKNSVSLSLHATEILQLYCLTEFVSLCFIHQFLQHMRFGLGRVLKLTSVPSCKVILRSAGYHSLASQQLLCFIESCLFVGARLCKVCEDTNFISFYHCHLLQTSHFPQKLLLLLKIMASHNNGPHG